MDAPRDYKPVIMAALAIAVLLRAAPAPCGDDDVDGVPVTHTTGAAGRTLIVPPEIQRQAGLALVRLDGIEIPPETPVQGRVVDVGPLLDLRWRYRETQAQEESARAAVSQARTQRERLLSLRRDPRDVSARQLQEAETVLADTTARLHAAVARRQALRERLTREWGDAVATRAIAADNDGLLFGGEALLLVAAGGDPITTETAAVASMVGARTTAVPIRFVGPAPAAPAALPGAAWYALAPAADFRVGAYVRVWIACGQSAQPGVRIPRDAVVWHAGLPWAYRKLDETRFARFSLAGAVDEGDGWFLAESRLAGAAIVVRGAQTLLSEELRAQIPDEDDDP